MSLTKVDRKDQSGNGTNIPVRFAAEVASALRREYGDSRAALKTIVALTGTNERAVKNWFNAKNGPSGTSLIVLCRQSDEVFETILRLAGRSAHLKMKKLVAAKEVLVKMLVLLSELED